MALDNKAGFFQRAYVQSAVWLSLGLLGGCSHAARKPTPPPPPPAVQATDIGIPACNAYLNSYLACHRAAHIFPADALQSHYEAMLSSLQQSAADPQVRPYLPARCVMLRQQLETTMQGQPCTTPATTSAPPQTGQPASTTPIRTQG
jgi:hypothetical protein